MRTPDFTRPKAFGLVLKSLKLSGATFRPLVNSVYFDLLFKYIY